jgi:hypothetical protein
MDVLHAYIKIELSRPTPGTSASTLYTEGLLVVSVVVAVAKLKNKIY